jgi:hypothetical protein
VIRSTPRFIAIASLAVAVGTGYASQAPKAEFTPDYHVQCPCDHSVAETLLAYPQCSLCLESEFHNPAEPLFFVQDIDPDKPNRWLALPKAHATGLQSIAELSPDASRTFWTAAIRKAEELWGPAWGLAVNGELARSQCHAHVHIGKLLDGVETPDFLFRARRSRAPGNPPLTVAGPAAIRPSDKSAAYWIHPVGKALHVHVEDKTAVAEFVLMR